MTDLTFARASPLALICGEVSLPTQKKTWNPVSKTYPGFMGQKIHNKLSTYRIIISHESYTRFLVEVFFAQDSSFNMLETHSISFTINPIGMVKKYTKINICMHCINDLASASVI